MGEISLAPFHARLRRRERLRRWVAHLSVVLVILSLLLLALQSTSPIVGTILGVISLLVVFFHIRSTAASVTVSESQTEALAEALLATEGALGAALRPSPFREALVHTNTKSVKALTTMPLAPLLNLNQLLLPSISSLALLATVIFQPGTIPESERKPIDLASVQHAPEARQNQSSRAMTLAQELRHLRSALLAEQATPTQETIKLMQRAIDGLESNATNPSSSDTSSSTGKQIISDQLRNELLASGILNEEALKYLSEAGLPPKIQAALLEAHLNTLIEASSTNSSPKEPNQTPSLLSQRKSTGNARASHSIGPSGNVDTESPIFKRFATSTLSSSALRFDKEVAQNYLKALNRALAE